MVIAFPFVMLDTTITVYAILSSVVNAIIMTLIIILGFAPISFTCYVLEDAFKAHKIKKEERIYDNN